MNPEHIPAELRSLRQWVCWNLQQVQGRPKPAKVPLTITGGHAQTSNPATWATYDECLATAQAKGWAGVGFVFTAEDPYVGVDLDWKPDEPSELGPVFVDSGAFSDWARDIVVMFPGAYIERSQSGNGIHLIMKGKLPPGGNRRGPIETYQHGRYFAITADIIGEPVAVMPDLTAPLSVFHAKYIGGFSEPGRGRGSGGSKPSKEEQSQELTAEDKEILKKLRGSKRDAKRFHRMFNVGESDPNKQSEADFDLACMLCRFSSSNEQVERIMWASKLRRPKWEQHRTLVGITVNNARDFHAANIEEKELGLAKRRVRAFSDIEREKVSWLWPGVIPYGKITMIIGDPGHGKTFITIDLAARLSKDGIMPDKTQSVPVRSLLMFNEDSAGDTIRPRLEAAGSDLANVFEFSMVFEDGTDRLPDFDTDLIEVELAITENQVRLLVVDPLTAYLGDKTNAWKDDDVRRLLSRVNKMAERTRCAVVCIMHLNKKQTTNVLQRATGAGAFTAVARSVWMCGVHPDDRDIQENPRKLFAPVKMNLAKVKGGWIYTVEDTPDEAGKVAWGNQTMLTATDMVKAEIVGISGDLGKLEEAIAYLREELATGEKPAQAILEKASHVHGISETTLKRARKEISIKARKVGEGGKEFWVWRLPETSIQKPSPPENPGDGGDLPWANEEQPPLPSDPQGF